LFRRPTNLPALQYWQLRRQLRELQLALWRRELQLARGRRELLPALGQPLAMERRGLQLEP
jgi:hypothetical protein